MANLFGMRKVKQNKNKSKLLLTIIPDPNIQEMKRIDKEINNCELQLNNIIRNSMRYKSLTNKLEDLIKEKEVISINFVKAIKEQIDLGNIRNGEHWSHIPVYKIMLANYDKDICEYLEKVIMNHLDYYV